MAEQPATVASSHVPGQRATERPESLSEVSITATIVAGLLDAAPDGLLLLDSDGRLALVSLRIEEMFGYSRGELLGQPVELLVPESLRSRHVDHRREFAERPRLRPMGAAMTLHGRHRDGSEFPVEISLSPLVAGDGQWTVAAVRDVRERRAAEHVRQSAAVEEQTRNAEEVADSVVRGLFDAGLQLQGLVGSTDGRVRDELRAVIERIDTTIREVSSAIFDVQRQEVDAR